MNTYCMFDLCRPRHRRGNRGRRAFTDSAAAIDLLGFEQAPSDMSDEDAPAARGGFGGRARRHVDRDDDRHRSCWRKSDFPLEDAFKGCRVKVHEDVPRHIHRLFLALGIQFRWLLTRTELARKLVSAEDLLIDNAKEIAWMDCYACP